MQDRIRPHLRDRRFRCPGIGDIGSDQGRVLWNAAAMPAPEAVKHRYLMPCLDQALRGEAADVAGSPCHNYTHRLTSGSKSWIGPSIPVIFAVPGAAGPHAKLAEMAPARHTEQDVDRERSLHVDPTQGENTG